MNRLLDNQLMAINKLQKYKVGALFMEPGTGKTRTAIELINTINSDYVLWLTPFQTKESLKNELIKWEMFNVSIYGIESLSSSDRLYLKLLNDLKSASKPFIIIDESLKIKNWDAVRTKRIIELGRICEYKLILNGTPISRNILDIWAQMEFLSPNILKMSKAKYINTFCEWVRITKRVGLQVKTKEWISKFHNVDYLYSLISHYVFESDLKLDLKKQFINVPYSINKEIMDEYNRIKKVFLNEETLSSKNNNIFIEMTQMLQKSYCIADDKFSMLDKILSTYKKENVIVYAKYVLSINELKNRYPDLKIMSYGKHSYGLNLQEYNVIVFWDKTWDYAQRIQAERRIFRTGQEHDCMYYSLSGNVGLEKMIDKNIENKTNILNHFRALSINQLNNLL